MVKKNKMAGKDIKQENSDKTIDNKENKAGQKADTSGNGETVGGDVIVEEDTGKGKKTGREHAKEKDSLKELEAKLAEMQDKYIRLSAEFDNYRKRTLREKMDISKYAGENLLLKIIPLMDDFDRAMAHMDSATDCVAIKNGIDLIYGKFSEFLRQNGVNEIESMNQAFNVDLHEAVAKAPVDDDKKKGKVVDVVLKGYYLQDKVLRFSKVVVGE